MMKHLFQKVETFSIRKLSIGACSVIIGAALFSGITVQGEELATPTPSSSNNQIFNGNDNPAIEESPVSENHRSLVTKTTNINEQPVNTEVTNTTEQQTASLPSNNLEETVKNNKEVSTIEHASSAETVSELLHKEETVATSLNLEENHVEVKSNLSGKSEKSIVAETHTENQSNADEDILNKQVEPLEYLLSSISKLDINSDGLNSLIEQYSVDTSSSLSESSLQSVKVLNSSNSNVTREEVVAWAKNRVGKYSPYSGNRFYDGQCVALIRLLAIEKFPEWRHSGNAIDYISKVPLPSGWQRIKNTPDFVPQPGDIALYNGAPSNGGYGHIGIIIEADINTSLSVEQNVNEPGNQGGPAKLVRGYYKNFWGVIRPAYATPVTPAPPVQRYDVNQLASQHGKTVSDGDYHIVLQENPGFALDLNGRSATNGTNIHLWNTNQTFTVKYLGNGYYTIVSKHAGTAVDAGGNGKGDNVYGYALHGHQQQQWLFKPTGDGQSFEIVHRHSGLVLDIEGGNIADGTNIRLWKPMALQPEKFRFASVDADANQTIADGRYHLISKLSDKMGLDVAPDNNVQLYDILRNSKQIFDVRYLGNGYYHLTDPNTGRRLDVTNDKYYNSTNVWVASPNVADAQQWIIRDTGDGYYEVIAKRKNMALDVAAPYGQFDNGTNVQMWVRHGGDNQKWKFIKEIQYVEGWKQDKNGWLYQYSDGTYIKNDWKQINNVWYHFDSSGYMQTGWQNINGSDYYFKSSGAMASDEWVNNKYYVDKSGRWIPNKNKITTGWKSDNRGWWYENSDGSYPKNDWKLINNKWYYFNTSGYMVTGWQKINGNDYYFKATGEMASDEWVDDKYYVDKSGRWLSSKKKTTAGWKSNSTGWWYENTDGSYPKNDWKQINNLWYYFDASGYMVTGWKKINGYDYYFKSSGAMASDEWVDNKYYVDKSGRWIP